MTSLAERAGHRRAPAGARGMRAGGDTTDRTECGTKARRRETAVVRKPKAARATVTGRPPGMRIASSGSGAFDSRIVEAKRKRNGTKYEITLMATRAS